jgi:GR25 family glycosyltransferase involved in LPS biosynthesis
MEAEAQRIGIALSFVQAIDGAGIDLDAAFGYDRKGRLRYAPDLKPEEVACVLSHQKALQTFLASAAEVAVILEDDARLSERLPVFARAAKNLPMEWDAIKLEIRKEKPLQRSLARIGDINLHATAFLSAGSTGWMYSRQGAGKVLQSLRHFRHAYDTHLGFFWRYGLVALCVDRPLIWESGLPSTIRPVRAVHTKKLTVAQWLCTRFERIEHSFRKRIEARMLARRFRIQPR